MRKLIPTLYWRLGSPDAINWVSVVALLIFQTSASLITSGVNFSDQFGLFLAVRVGSLGVFLALLGLGKWVLVRVDVRWLAPLITLGVFLAGITASTAAFDWLLVTTQLAEQSFLARRIILSVVGATLILVMVALVVSTARDYARANRILEDAITDIDNLRRDAEERIEKRQGDLVDTIRELIDDSLNAARLPGAKADGVMQHLIDDVIRPLSHALGKQSDSPTIHSSPTESAIPWRQVVSGAMYGTPFTLFAFPGAIGAIIATFLVMSFGVVGTATTLSVFAMAVAINALLALLWRGIPKRLPVGVRIVVYTLSVTPFWLVSVAFIRFATGFDLAATPVRLTAWTMIVLATWWVAVLTTSVFRQLKEANTDLETTRHQLKTHLASVNATDHQLRRNISRILHGPIQEAVASSLRKLHNTPELANNPGFFDAMRERIDTALGALHPDVSQPVDIAQELDDLREVWEGSVAIDVTIDHATKEALSTTPQTAHVVLELIREACHNAIKHGDANAINIALEADVNTGGVRFSVSNNGAPPQKTRQPGMGTSLFDSLCVSWSIDVTDEMVIVTGKVPQTRFIGAMGDSP